MVDKLNNQTQVEDCASQSDTNMSGQMSLCAVPATPPISATEVPNETSHRTRPRSSNDEGGRRSTKRRRR